MADSIRVMLVDDHEVVRKGIRALIEVEEGMEVVGEAANGAEALRNVPLCRPDVVVMDVRMPDGGGIEACRALRDAHPDIQVIMLTSYSDDEALFNSIMAGAAGYILKQIRGRDLVDGIRTVASGHSLLDPGVTKRVLERLKRAKVEDQDPGLARLSPTEARILDMIAEGSTNKGIAAKVNLSEKTVKNYVSSILQKLSVARRSEAAAYVVRAHSRETKSDHD